MHDSSIIDLHCHSTASDGTYAPKEVAALAQKIGLSAIALTDHDTIDGLAEFQAAGNALGIEAIAGIEFAALWEHFHRPEIHIVGLGFDPAHPVLKGRMGTIRSSRDIRNRRMCERLSSIGLHLTLDEVAANAGGRFYPLYLPRSAGLCGAGISLSCPLHRNHQGGRRRGGSGASYAL